MTDVGHDDKKQKPMKKLLLIVLVIILGVFIYLKVEIGGDPNSNFNQTMRYSLGAHPLLRTILGLHSAGDARAEYLGGTGPITVEWFAPQEDNIDQSTLNQFATLVSKYTGRQTQVASGGSLSDDILPLSNLGSYKLNTSTQSTPAGGSQLLVFLADDYSPRPSTELSTTYQESGIVLSLNAHKEFLQNYPGDLDRYLLSSMLREFGSQIGLPQTPGGSSECIMGLQDGINGQPLEAFGQSDPQDFCPAEQAEIQNLKQQFSN